MDTIETFGFWVRRRRKSLDLTLEGLAKCVWCAVVTLRKIESNERRPSRQMAKRLAQCLLLSEEETSDFLAIASGERPISRLVPYKDSLGKNSSSNLPVPLTSLIGRSDELTSIVTSLRRKEVRLHTLTGPIGVGKTRLAIEAGLKLQNEFKDGVYLVSLSQVKDPAVVPTITAAVLGIREMNSRNLAKSISNYLIHKEMLLIFDNFEHLMPAAEFLTYLLQFAPDLSLLVTSRATLHLYGEHEFIVLPMLVPNTNDPKATIQADCIRLFCERAQAAMSDFIMTPELVPVVAEICRRLDGLPLAIELAAARIKLFSVKELLLRLENHSPTLAQDPSESNPKDLVLEDAISWSYGLLPPSARVLLNRLSIFKSSFTLAEAEAVCAFPFTIKVFSTNRDVALEMPDISYGIALLQDQSLLFRQKINPGVEETRYLILEIICEFAMKQLRVSNELELLQQRLADYFATNLERAETDKYEPGPAAWRTWMELDGENLKASFSWL